MQQAKCTGNRVVHSTPCTVRIDMKHLNRTFIHGNRNPERYGFSVRSPCGEHPDTTAILKAASILGREPFYIDERGYECDIFAAAIHPDGDRLAYVESRAKKRWWTPMVYIAIKIHLHDSAGKASSVDIKSYNPFFGCDVGYFDWIGDTAVLIYQEKHETYACAFGTNWPPTFITIEDRWMVKDSILAYIGYEMDVVQRLAVPDLSQLDSISVHDAEQKGQMPPDSNSI